MRANSILQAIILIFAMFTSVVNTTDDEQIVNSFLKHVESIDSISDQQKSDIKLLLEDFLINGITDSLVEIYPTYLKAVESSDQSLLKEMTHSDDKFLAADANFFLARSMIADQEFENALPIIESLADNKYSAYTSNILYPFAA